LLFLILLNPLGFGQEKPDKKTQLELFQKAVEGTQFEKLHSLLDPNIPDFIAIAERANKRIYSQDSPDLRQLARELEEKVSELQTNRVGKWIATQPNLVAFFSEFDSHSISVNDKSLIARRERLKASVSALNAYNPTTQGRFDADTNEAAQAILEDANWVEQTYKQLRELLSTILHYEAECPEEFDASGLPTLKQAIDARATAMLEAISVAQQQAEETAAKQAAELLGESIVKRRIAAAKTQVAGEEKLAEFNLRLMEAEFGVKMKETEKQIVETQLQERRVGDSIIETKSRSYDERLTEYLQSDRVRQLLQPFCGKGFAEASTGNEGYKRISSLEEAPMSLGIINQRRALSPDHQSMIWLLKIANFSRNDRGGWPVDQNTYGSAPKDFANMEGEKVNPYIEAQRILREHGAKLIELKMLRP